jgi:hypothetical protein
MSETLEMTRKIANKKNENPFYGKQELLALYHGATVPLRELQVLLNRAAGSCKSKEDWQLLYVVIFNIGDITDRNHDLLLKTYGAKGLEKGGNSARKNFLYCLTWMVNNKPEQFYEFLPLIHEYTNFENLFFYQLRTDRTKGSLHEIISIVPSEKEKREVFVERVTSYLASIISDSNTPVYKLSLLAKFLKYPRFSKRSRVTKSGEKVKKNLTHPAFLKEVFEAQFALSLSKKLGWDTIVHKNNTEYVGLKKFKQTYNQLNEDVLFSTKKIFSMDKASFISWLDSQPAGARYRIGRRLTFKPEVYVNQAAWFNEWIALKEKASQEARKLEAKETLTEKEQSKLQYLQKAAKVNTGAVNFVDLVKDIFSSKASDISLVADNLLRKVDFKVPVLPIVDTSSSMDQRINGEANLKVIDFASLLATVVLLKNPSEDAKNLLFTFNDSCQIITDGLTVSVREGRFLSAATKQIDKIVNKESSFLANYEQVRSICYPTGSTSLRSVAERLNYWANQDASQKEYRKELINQFPIVLVLSDGDLNSDGSAKESMLAFQHTMRVNFGWEGIVVVWDVNESSHKEKKFSNLENVIYLSTFNVSNLTQVFTKIHDLDVIDVYTPLKSLYLSNRYELVKSLTL